jgi:hypothetical protein
MPKLIPLDFACGRSLFLDSLKEAPETTAKVFVKICLNGEIESSFYAQVDTGAAWSILAPRVAAELGFLDQPGKPTILSTHLGRIKGVLIRLPVRFLADEGDSFETEGTFFVSPDWPSGRTFLGYSGLLEFIRFAFDPQANHFYFGSGV